jgi:hypothetical protein
MLHGYVREDTTHADGLFLHFEINQSDHRSIHGVEQLLAQVFLYEDWLYNIVYAVDRHVILLFCEKNDRYTKHCLNTGILLVKNYRAFS